MNNFAKNILYLRKKRKLTQAEMPDLTGVSRVTWSNYENGNTEPDIATLLNISKAFNVSIDYILKEDLALNVHLIENDEEKNNGKNVHLNVHPNVSEAENNMINDPALPYAIAKKGQLDLLILKQLNIIADDVKEMKAKLLP